MVGNINNILNKYWFVNIHDDKFGCWNFKFNIEHFCGWGVRGMIIQHLRSLIELTYGIESVDVDDWIACLFDKKSLSPFQKVFPQVEIQIWRNIELTQDEVFHWWNETKTECIMWINVNMVSVFVTCRRTLRTLVVVVVDDAVLWNRIPSEYRG